MQAVFNGNPTGIAKETSAGEGRGQESRAQQQEERLCADNEISEERWKASCEELQRTVKGSRKPRKVRKSFKKGQKTVSNG